MIPQFRRLGFACFVLAITGAGRATAHESVPAPPSIAKAVQLHQYFYVDFPRQLAALDGEIALAERAVAILRARVIGYEPFRSFGRYAATYSADQLAQLDLLAAERDLQCLQLQRDDLWRQRQMMAMHWMIAASH